jgi:hypothetical protein
MSLVNLGLLVPSLLTLEKGKAKLNTRSVNKQKTQKNLGSEIIDGGKFLERKESDSSKKCKLSVISRLVWSGEVGPAHCAGCVSGIEVLRRQIHR